MLNFKITQFMEIQKEDKDLMEIFKRNRKFFFHVLIISIGTWMSYSQYLESFGMFLIVKDPKNGEEMERGKLALALISITYFFSMILLI